MAGVALPFPRQLAFIEMHRIASGGSELDDDSSSNTSKRKKRENRTPLELKFEQYIRTAFNTSFANVPFLVFDFSRDS